MFLLNLPVETVVCDKFNKAVFVTTQSLNFTKIFYYQFTTVEHSRHSNNLNLHSRTMWTREPLRAALLRIARWHVRV